MEILEKDTVKYDQKDWPFSIEKEKISPTGQKKTLYKIKAKKKTYPWPCEIEPDRVITVTDNDLFSKTLDGTIIKHTGVSCFGIIIPDKDLEEIYD